MRDRWYQLKDVRWRGDSKDAAHRFPKGVRLKLGKELTRIQLGMQPRNGKWLTGVGQGIQEIRVAHAKDAYRVVYVATFGDAVYVLHAFQKKSKAGIETPHEDVAVVVRRYRELMRERRGR